jgi:hypothetical protein
MHFSDIWLDSSTTAEAYQRPVLCKLQIQSLQIVKILIYLACYFA